MKKCIPIMLSLLTCLASGCTINYDSYYEKYGDISNKDDTLNSVKIDENVMNYPDVNTSLIEKYSVVYQGVSNDYQIYSTYYSPVYNTLYISYDKKSNPVQTIKSKELALMEEHLLNYFEMDENKTLYKDYLKVVRVYPDYHSSVCRGEDDSEETYSQVEGCATYDALEAAINLNGLKDIKRFFNTHSYTQDNTKYTLEPKRDTFAHEFGHVATYYHLFLKGDGSYEDYLRLRLKDRYDVIYNEGLHETYENDNYITQPVEILADDYVELYYKSNKKASNDYYNYDIEYQDLRNSLTGVVGVSKFLKEDRELFDTMKEYYDVYIKNDYLDYQTKKAVSFSGLTYTSIHDVINNNPIKLLTNKDLIVLGEITIQDKEYYRVVLSNVITNMNIRREYDNIGYILKSECTDIEKDILYFTKYDNKELSAGSYLHLQDSNIHIAPYFDFSYFIHDESIVYISNNLDDDFTTLYMDYNEFR